MKRVSQALNVLPLGTWLPTTGMRVHAALPLARGIEPLQRVHLQAASSSA